ncbi:beta-galactosidase [Sphaerosporella brunnea]|uniref:beta-galactosidase n=1 Tax=Sphaerosporella brunnea TaxID=1250544 RepID=A0A5J5EZS7_9PEZI|nr:beta-galactosidase [Sphaerosporella brunnea]
MRNTFFHAVLLACGLVNAGSDPDLKSSSHPWPLHDDGVSKVVEWDHYSLKIHGERVFLWSGEIHYWRVPVPELWEDILQKIKAGGFNAVGLYSHWGYHSAADDGVVDFESGAHDFKPIFEIAKRLGLWVVFRPGPYVNAETTAGGFPGWLTTGEYGTLRNNDTRYTQAWGKYMTAIAEYVGEYQITKGGNIILYQLENEFGEQWTNPDTKEPNLPAIAYNTLLQENARENGIDIPTFSNNPNMWTRSWSHDYSGPRVGGDLDIYGLDHYPECWSCDLAECTATNGNGHHAFSVFEYYTHFQQTSPTQPQFMPEFQGGAYNPWGGPQGGCASNTGTEFVNVFYRHNVAQKVVAMNLYMLFGGTSWGGLPAPVVATSYDYAAPISEGRELGAKFYETKLLGLQLRVARDLTMTELVNNGTEYTDNTAIYTTELRNPVTNGGFYFTRHALSYSYDKDTFKISVNTSLGSLIIPQYAPPITLNGRESKILPTDFRLGSLHLIYSTAELLTASILDGKPVLVLWAPAGESAEFQLGGAKRGFTASRGVKIIPKTHGVVVAIDSVAGSSTVEFADGTRVVVVSRDVAYTTWNPALTNDPFSRAEDTVIVFGPQLVRSAEIKDRTLVLTGDNANATSIEVFAPARVNKLTFNGAVLHTKRSVHGSLLTSLPASAVTVETLQSSLPRLKAWKYSDALPERGAEYDDSRWVLANHTSTLAERQPDTFPVLYSDEYGFHSGPLMFRGHFSGAPKWVFLSVIGGAASGWSAYVNGYYLGSAPGKYVIGDLGINNLTLPIPASAFNPSTGGGGVLTVVADHTGKDLRDGALEPRGILNATLSSGEFTHWKIAGAAGGERNIDPIRGTLAEGGLHAERAGWHLPGFDDGAWSGGVVASPEEGFGGGAGEVRFYRTTAKLEVPSGYDAAVAVVLGAPESAVLRAQVYVNGYMMGKFVPHIGHQVEFPVFPGIMNYRGDNVVGLHVWDQSGSGSGSGDGANVSVSVELKVVAVTESCFDVGFDAGYLQPPWTQERELYA